VSSFGDAEASGPEVCAQAIIEQKQKESVRKWTVFFIIGNQNTSFRLLSKARRILCPGKGTEPAKFLCFQEDHRALPNHGKYFSHILSSVERIEFRLARRVLAGIRGSWASTPVIWSKLTSIQSHLDNRSEIRRNGMAEIRLHEGESIENALRRFKRKVMQEDIIKEVRKHSFYLKPGEKKRIKQALARKRSRKKVRREPQEDRK